MSEKLKPCPKCGCPLVGVTTKNYQYQVSCCSCGFSTPIYWGEYGKAIEMWNSSTVVEAEE